jgi:prohibitin 1
VKLFNRYTDGYQKGDISSPASGFWLLIIGGILFLWLLFGTIRVVGVGQVGIVTRFGQVTREESSGVVFKAPWPIEHMTKMNIKTQKEQQDATAATHDLQSVTTTLALNYHLTPKTAREVFQQVGTNYPDVTIDPIIQEAIKSITANYNAEELISNRAKVEVALNDRLVSKLQDRGITVDNVSIVNFTFSKSFDEAIEQKQVAQQNAQKAAYELQAAQQKAQAQDAQAKTLTPEYLQLQAIERWDGHMPSTYSSDGSGLLFNIPAKQ